MRRGLFVLDMDGTLLLDNSWLVLHKAFGLTALEDDVLLQLYQEGVVNYREWTDLIVRIYKSRGYATKARAYNALNSCRVHPQANQLVKTVKELGLQPVVLSGGLDVLVQDVARRLQIKRWAANHTMAFNDEGALEDLVIQDDDVAFKVSTLEYWCEKLDIDPTQCFCLGDGQNDEGIFKLTRRGILVFGSSAPPESSLCWRKVSDIANVIELLRNEVARR